jgi:hypothetical protein
MVLMFLVWWRFVSLSVFGVFVNDTISDNVDKENLHRQQPHSMFRWYVSFVMFVVVPFVLFKTLMKGSAKS